MRICHYPGRVVDATLSLDQKSPMETIYQNNWLNADKTIKTIGRNSAAVRNGQFSNSTNTSPSGNQYRNEPLDRKYFSQSSGSSAPQSSSDDENRRNSISSLGRYQETLEHMQKLDLNQSNELFRKTMRNLNGYKPSTIRQKHRRNYDGWDEFKEKAIDEEVKTTNGGQKNGDWQSNGYKYDALDNKKIGLIPKIKRSQTMRVTSSFANANHIDRPHINNSINIRNVFSQRQNQEQIAKMPTATINKNFNRFKRNNLPSIQNGNGNSNASDETHLNRTPDSNRNGHNNDNGMANNQTECIIPSNFSQFTMKSNGCIKTEPKPNGTCDNELSNGKTKKKPLLRAKSVRINPTPLQDIHFDRMMSSDHETNDPNANNTTNNNCDKRPSNGFKERLSLQHKKLPRLTSIMKKKPIVIVEEPTETQPTTNGKPVLDQWINFHKKSTEQLNDGETNRNQNSTNSKPEKHSSTSSLSSISSGCADCNSNVSDFSIPRPRLIVPVHTYARKRRTGNLIQNQTGDYDHIDSNTVIIKQPPRNSNNKQNGKRVFFSVMNVIKY